jgi:hypothetical protein
LGFGGFGEAEIKAAVSRLRQVFVANGVPLR